MDPKEKYFAQSVKQIIRFFYYATGDFQTAIQLTIACYVEGVFRHWRRIEQLDYPSLYVFVEAYQLLRSIEKNDKKSSLPDRYSTTIEVPVPEELEYQFETHKILLTAMQRMSTQNRAMLIFCGIEGYEIEQAAKMLGFTNKRAAAILKSALDDCLQQVLENPDLSSIMQTNAFDRDGDERPSVDQEWILQQLSMSSKWKLTYSDLESVYNETKRIYLAAKKRRVMRVASICTVLMAGVVTLSIGEWKFGWISHTSEEVFYELDGTVPTIIPESTRGNSLKSEMLITDTIIHGGHNNQDAMAALQLVRERAPFKVYSLPFVSPLNQGGIYLSDTKYDIKRHTLDLEYNFGLNTIHIWEAPSTLVQDRFKNQGTLHTYSSRPWYEKQNGHQTIYSTVFDGTMIVLESQLLADSEPILSGIFTPTNIATFDGTVDDGQGGKWLINCFYEKVEGPEQVNLQLMIQGLDQYTRGSNKVGFRLQGSSIHTWSHTDAYLLPNNSYYEMVITEEKAVPSSQDVLHFTIDWQGHQQTTDLHYIPISY